jgi:hypothetical protein
LEKLFGVLFSVYRGKPGHNEFVLACLQGAWHRLLGDKLAAVCKPARFDGSTLVIQVIDPQWEDAIRSVGTEIIGKLRSATAGEVAKLTVVSCQSPVVSERNLSTGS